MRRGIKEMDIILSRYAEAHLSKMDEADLDLYETLLNENDQDLYQWVSGQAAAPAALSDLIAKIAAHVQGAE
jgi:antitoxin CptB